MGDCRHGSVVTYAISDGGDERMWACADCMIRFYPACRECVDIGHRNERHAAATGEVERLREALAVAMSLLADALRVQRQPCNHKGIGLPGCVICDPRVYPEARAALEEKPQDRRGVRLPPSDPSLIGTEYGPLR